MFKTLSNLYEKVKNGEKISKKEALFILNLDKEFLPDLLFFASSLRKKYFQNKIATCSIINAKSGKCSEDCKYCAQSSHFKTNVTTYDLKQKEEILKSAVEENSRSLRFSIVTSGKKPSKEELNRIKETFQSFDAFGVTQKPCASVGILSKEELLELKNSGLTRFHHNIESSKNFFSNICTTHTFEQRIETIKNAKEVGLEVCVGGILGLGESFEDRVDFLFEIKNINPNSVPLNFLNPVKGTPLENQKIIDLWDAIKIIALARFVLPNKIIKIGAGRLEVFKDNQALPFLAGANGMIVGNLLTTKGRNPQEDLDLIKNLGFQISE